MNNRLYMTVIIVLSLIFCTACKSRDDSSDTEGSASDYYQVRSLESDLTFDDLVEYLTDKLGVEYYDPFEDGINIYVEGYARYYRDYMQFIKLQRQQEIEYNDPGRIEGFEYHINRLYSYADNISTQINIYKLDSLIAARLIYIEDINYWYLASDENSSYYVIKKDAVNGVLLVYNRSFFYAHYLIGKSLLTFSINISTGGADPYMEFLEIADDLDLPVSDEISEAILPVT